MPLASTWYLWAGRFAEERRALDAQCQGSGAGSASPKVGDQTLLAARPARIWPLTSSPASSCARGDSQTWDPLVQAFPLEHQAPGSCRELPGASGGSVRSGGAQQCPDSLGSVLLISQSSVSCVLTSMLSQLLEKQRKLIAVNDRALRVGPRL